MSCIWREASDLFHQRRCLWVLKSRYHKCSASGQTQNIFSLIQHLLKLLINRGSRHHITPSLLRWQEESSLTLSAHTRADGFAVYVTKHGAVGLLGKFMFGIKIFPGCEAVLLLGCGILILEGRVKRHCVLCNPVWVGEESTEVFSNFYEEKSATQPSPLFLAILLSPAKTVPALNLIKPRLFTWCLVAHFRVVVVSCFSAVRTGL